MMSVVLVILVRVSGRVVALHGCSLIHVSRQTCLVIVMRIADSTDVRVSSDHLTIRPRRGAHERAEALVVMLMLLVLLVLLLMLKLMLKLIVRAIKLACRVVCMVLLTRADRAQGALRLVMRLRRDVRVKHHGDCCCVWKKTCNFIAI